MDGSIHLIYAAFLAYPIWRIFSRVGKSRFFILFLILPIGLVVILYILAYSKWPLIDEQEGV